MIVFCAITPHSPLVIPSIGAENQRFVTQTARSLETIADHCATAKPDALIIISPHGTTAVETFSLNQSPVFDINFKQFGDLETVYSAHGDVARIHHYKELLESAWPITLHTEPELDHGIGIPWHFIQAAFGTKKPKLIPLYPSNRSPRDHFAFGSALQEDMINDTGRIAVLASADLSHRLSADTPAGESHWAPKFDQTVKECLTNDESNRLISLDKDFIEEAGECGLRPISILLGMLHSIEYTPSILSYEAPLGVGYLSAEYKLQT